MPIEKASKRIAVLMLIVSTFFLVSLLNRKELNPDQDRSLTPVGSFLVQLGAYDTRSAADEALEGIRSMTGDTTERYEVSILEVEHGSEHFFRLRLYPFSDFEHALSLCDELASWEVICVPVRQNDS